MHVLTPEATGAGPKDFQLSFSFTSKEGNTAERASVANTEENGRSTVYAVKSGKVGSTSRAED